MNTEKWIELEKKTTATTTMPDKYDKIHGYIFKK